MGTAAAAAAAGEPAPDPSPEMLRAAYWLAARDGLAGTGVDVRTGRRAGFRELAGDLLAYALPALRDAGDLDAVAGGLRHLLAGGTGRSGSARPTASAGGSPTWSTPHCCAIADPRAEAVRPPRIRPIGLSPVFPSPSGGTAWGG